ncbi:MAG: nucleoside triphosphate pyrophosphohydrolase, partial [Anaerolineae bacterium]|nr:nucleoside triphosphate pyrophosphohydrolase [Anaerolineae bacterium]
EILRNWEEIKRTEKGVRQVSASFAGISSALPALARAQAISERAARVGFDWPDEGAVWREVAEELQALRGARSAEERSHELGDLLFALVNGARWLDLDAESALREATARFMARVVAVEEEAAALGRRPEDLSADELTDLWRRARRQSRDQA